MKKGKYVFNPEADIEVLFQFNGKRRYSMANGFCTSFAITDDLCVVGKHHYYSTQFIPPNGLSNGSVTFLATDNIPRCLWNGKSIPILENGRVIGTAEITKIFNSALEQTEHA